ncbi:unnamed protein product [Cyclocybe aegerita]|uniref:tRNA-splicing endonuclease subunit Sen54 N-terminal domain-containing protein n=1 Tax=Cyclocybe aegerita TaxID=1973307 RepID=A0A8S0WD41_CYCAE|nr:unnamed protein product [Cyclocybe aegerita]
MDDSLEAPNALLSNAPLGDQPPEDDEGPASDEEDGGLDWTKLLPPSQRPVIPKRGEKEFEPRGAGGTNLQQHVLDRSRNAMFDTLRATRTTSSKAISYATWYPKIARTHVTVARGIHFSTMGHSAPRAIVGEDGISKIQKRLELLPEEAIYLIERGTLFCWKAVDLELGDVPGLEEVGGAPMTVQQAYSEMIGKEDLTLEKFQVYAYLKRLGYMVTRTNPPDSHYPVPSSLAITRPAPSILERIRSIFPQWISSIWRVLFGRLDWWKPVKISRWLQGNKSYLSLYHSMRFMSAGHKVPLHSSKATLGARSTSPYRIFYNLYKPSTPFKKSAPPPPDFQIVVINARTTPMPTLQELTDLFDVLPEVPLPGPRQKRGPYGSQAPVVSATTAQRPTPTTAAAAPEPTPTSSPPPSFLRKFFPWFFHSSSSSSSLPLPATASAPAGARRINPFVALKTGKKVVIIAAVDTGNISFFRFGQGEFSEWPMA